MNRLKPCPFCGCADVNAIDKGNFSFIECSGCLGTFYQHEAHSVEDNMKAWNKRTIITKHDKYTFDGDCVCTDHMTIIQNGENNRHIENHGNVTITIGK